MGLSLLKRHPVTAGTLICQYHRRISRLTFWPLLTKRPTQLAECYLSKNHVHKSRLTPERSGGRFSAREMCVSCWLIKHPGQSNVYDTSTLVV